MAWATYSVDVTNNSNQVKVSGPVPSSSIPAGFEVIINGVANLEVAYGTDILYDAQSNPYSHLYLVRPYTGASTVAAEMIVKPTGSQFNDVVDLFRKGSNQATQLMANYYQFVESETPIIHQPLDENADPLSIDTLPIMNANVAAAIATLQGAVGSAAYQDYESGTWTLTLHGSSSDPVCTIGTMNCKYVKVGEFCCISWLIEVTEISQQGEGYLMIGGIPFQTYNEFTGSIANADIISETSGAVVPKTLNGQNRVVLTLISGRNFNTCDASTLNTGFLVGSITYKVD